MGERLQHTPQLPPNTRRVTCSTPLMKIGYSPGRQKSHVLLPGRRWNSGGLQALHCCAAPAEAILPTGHESLHSVRHRERRIHTATTATKQRRTRKIHQSRLGSGPSYKGYTPAGLTRSGRGRGCNLRAPHRHSRYDKHTHKNSPIHLPVHTDRRSVFPNLPAGHRSHTFVAGCPLNRPSGHGKQASAFRRTAQRPVR